jgi:hypothetical protein
MTSVNGTSNIYDIYVEPSVIHHLYSLYEQGSNHKFQETNKYNGKISDVQGNERGGHFCYNKYEENKKIKIYGIFEESLMEDTTSFNSGDFPFTFHTHPVVIKTDDYTNNRFVDNYPNIISDEDLIGSIQDNYYYNHAEIRNICDKTGNILSGGINFFDIVAVPYGLFVYRPRSNSKIMKYKRIQTIERVCQAIQDKTQNMLPKYDINSISGYSNISSKNGVKRLDKYITLLIKYGFNIDFFRWSEATENGITFKNNIPITSPIDDMCKC